MSVVDVVGMVPVRDSFVAAVGSMDVIVGLVGHVQCCVALVPMPLVGPVDVSVMQVVGVVAVADSGVPAVRTVVMVMARMLHVDQRVETMGLEPPTPCLQIRAVRTSWDV